MINLKDFLDVFKLPENNVDFYIVVVEKHKNNSVSTRQEKIQINPTDYAKFNVVEAEASPFCTNNELDYDLVITVEKVNE